MQKKKVSKLGIKYVLSTLLPALIIVVMFGAMCYVVVSQNQLGTVKQGVVEQSGLIDRSIYDKLLSLEEKLSFDDNYKYMYNYIKNSNKNKDSYYLNKITNVLDKYISSNSECLVSGWMAAFDKNIYVTNNDDKNDALISNVNFSDEPWYDEAALSKGNAYISRIYTSELSDKYYNNKVVSIVIPIVDWKKNTKIGAYGIDVSMNYINSFIAIDGFEDTLFLLIDNKGNLQYCKNDVVPSKHEELNAVANEVFINHPLNVYVGGKKYYAIDTVYSKMGWKVISLISNEELKTSISTISLPIMVITLIACILLSVIMLKFIIYIVRKINVIKMNTIEIANGVYDNRMKIESDDEFGELAVAFNDAVDNLKYSAEHDPVTNIYNISTFYTKAHELIRNNDSASGRYAIIRLDIDHFRVINDIYNWQVGDNFLRHIAESIKNNLNGKSICARMSADMFVMCVRYSALDELEKTLSNIRDSIIEYDIVVNINAHFGIYLDAEKDLPVYLMCDRAAIALGIIKGNSLATFSYYDSSVNKMNMNIKFIETSTQAAFEENQFFIQLQPKYNMSSQEIVGAEALVRWKHPIKGLIRPDSFIPIFEKNGNILRLDEYVWEETCRCLSKWIKMGLKCVPVSVNISRIHVYNKHLLDKLCSLVEKYEIPVELLQLEFTESALLEDTTELYELMNRLKEKNFTLLMDDFASGYSSLNTLKSAPFDIVKLDKEFISAIAENERDKQLVKSTISMIDMQSMDIVVEGVETEEQVKILLEAGCLVAQGYYYSKPVNVKEFEKRAYGIE